MKKEPQKSLRDGAGHLDARVATDLLAHGHDGAVPEDDRAFFRAARSSDPLAEQLGESFVAAATGSEKDGDEAPDEAEAEERGGPFVESSSETEFAHGTDASNPRGATREPFPRT